MLFRSRPAPGMPTLQPQAAFPAPRAWPAGAAMSVRPLEAGGGRDPEASPDSREMTPSDQGHRAELQGSPEATWGNRQWPRLGPGSGPTLGAPGPHGTSGAGSCRHTSRGSEVVPSRVRATGSPLSKTTGSPRWAPWQRAGDGQLPRDLRGRVGGGSEGSVSGFWGALGAAPGAEVQEWGRPGVLGEIGRAHV